MQTREINKVDVFSAAKILAAIFGVFGLLYGVLGGLAQILTFFSKGKFSDFIFAIAVLVLAPIIMAIIGFIEGLILSLVYNFAAGRFGGLKYEVSATEN